VALPEKRLTVYSTSYETGRDLNTKLRPKSSMNSSANRANGHAYNPIIASGASSCVLHYNANNKQCKEGDILLMDFGCEYGNYASDLSRTIPVSGRFSERQKAVYNACLNVMKHATSMLKPGTVYAEYEKEVGKFMQSELIGLGLIDRHDVEKQDPASPLYKKYFMHGTSHFLGLDVHDVGNRDLLRCKAGQCIHLRTGHLYSGGKFRHPH
jgi:Xaa-Pro aminopeptidase